MEVYVRVYIATQEPIINFLLMHPVIQHSIRKSLSIIYFDAVNLYGYLMCLKLPTSNFRWLDSESIAQLKPYILNGETGKIAYGEQYNQSCVLEVDLSYSHAIHDSHADLPFCPKHRLCSKNASKLICFYEEEERYVIDISNLLQCIANGVKLTKIHRVITFNHSTWLKDYIMLNTNFRAKAKSKFEKDLFEKKNNACFGKILENIRNHRNVILITNGDWNKARKLIAKPNFKQTIIFNENLIAIEMKNVNIKLNKPLYLGMSILEFSKNLMYNFHYNYIKSERVSNF